MDAVSLEQHLQLSTYALCYLILKGAIPKLRLDVLTKTQKPKLERMATVRTLEDLAWTAHLIASVRQSIEAGHFFPNRSWRCGECEFLAHCQRWRG
jgi:CRISPR/Cas system-associated exonuclease Cas4 (RecB family)